MYDVVTGSQLERVDGITPTRSRHLAHIFRTGARTSSEITLGSKRDLVIGHDKALTTHRAGNQHDARLGLLRNIRFKTRGNVSTGKLFNHATARPGPISCNE